MSLQYIIDGYNLINSRLFARVRRKSQDPRVSLLAFIRTKKPCGSAKNKISIVFDGFLSQDIATHLDCSDVSVIFSRDKSADEKIKTMVEQAVNPKIVKVVSDDKEIRFIVKAAGAGVLSTEEFMAQGNSDARLPRTKIKKQTSCDSIKPDLTYGQIQTINDELAQRWLKKR